MEHITIINKSGKVVSTGKQLVNIFKDAKEAYQEKKAALHAEHQARIREKTKQKLERAREETQSVASSRHSRSSHRSSKSRKHKSERGGETETRPPLTERNLSQIGEGSVISSSTARKSRRSASQHGPRSLRDGDRGYRKPYLQDAEPSSPSLVRRHTDFPTGPPLPIQTTETQLTRSTVPPSYHTYAPPLHRSSSLPDIHDEGIDMNLAYGPTPHPSSLGAGPDAELKLATSMSRLDSLLLEAHCLQHSASAIISNLQNNPEAMAAVALTLAEISSLLTKMSPGIIATLKAGSPAIFALLACPQFLIGTGVVVGVTVIAFGGYKIIKKMQQNIEDRKEAHRMEEALVYEPEIELGSIDTWRRGIADVEAQSVSTSVDGEFITPEAARQRKERIRDRAREERIVEEEGSVVSKRSRRTVRKRNSEDTIGPEIQISPASESGSKRGDRKKGRAKEILMIEDAPREKKSRKGGSTISSLFKKKDRKLRDEDARESVLSLRPRTVEF